MSKKFFIRWMVPRDMDWVAMTEWMCFDDPISCQDFVDMLRKRNHVGLVALIDGELAGYILYEIFSDRYEIITFAVHEDFRRQGVGTKIMEKMKVKVSPQKRRKLIFEVRDSNLRGQLFLKKIGFKATGVTGDYYPMVYEKKFQETG